MTEKELIRAEIERRIKAYKTKNGFPAGTVCAIRIETYEGLLSFIDSLPEEKPSEDLNKLIQKWDRIDINTVLKVKVKATGKVIDGFYDGRGHFDHFIDHDVFDRYSIDEVELMPDEEPSDELEEAAENYRRKSYNAAMIPPVDGLTNEYGGSVKEAFIAGVEWQKEQMTKDAVEGEIVKDITNNLAVTAKNINLKGFKFGDKVKIIIVKQ